MASFFASLFTKNFSSEKVKDKEPNVTNFVYRDNLNKKPSTNKPKKGKRVSFASSVKPPQLAAGEKGGKNSEGLTSHASTGSSVSSVEENGVIRVKVRMTKSEAARLLSKCKDGGVLGFKDVANELVQIPLNRVDVMGNPTTTRATRASVLKSIPEEF